MSGKRCFYNAAHSAKGCTCLAHCSGNSCGWDMLHHVCGWVKMWLDTICVGVCLQA